MITRQQNRIHHLLVFLLIALSGFPFFYTDPLFRPLLFISFAFTFLLFINRKDLYTDRFLGIYVLVFIVASLGQALTFDFIPFTTVFGYVIRILLSYMVIKLVGKRFVTIVIQQLYVFCIISFFFYFSSLLDNNIETYIVQTIAPVFELPKSADAFYATTPNILIFNFNSGLGYSEILRNSGPFWEPGAFAGFIIIALIFNIILTKKLFNRRNVIFIIAILTTTSTSGYIALFLIIFFYYIQLSNNSVKFLLTPMIFIGALFSYYQFEFLGVKIDKSARSISTSNTSNRFVSALTDLEDIREYWIFGRGMNETTRYNFSDYMGAQEKHRNNGVTAILVNMGIIVGFLYFRSIYKSFAALCRTYGLTSFFAGSLILIILIIGFSEGYFTKVFFIALTMLHINYTREKKVIQ
jgi:hypothetical protein